MAVITFIFSYIAKQANSIVQAIFGWSVTALFGRLPRRSQLLVTGALVISLAWPLFVLGMFLPRVAAWAVALVPLHKLIGAGVLRGIWIALAVAAPLLVGILVSIASPHRTRSTARAVVAGYPMALGFFAAFLVVVITVPLLKIASIVRRWTDEHVYLQPREGRYADVVRDLAQACELAGYTPTIGAAPRNMVLATTIMRTLARGSVAPFVSEKLQRIGSDGIELYLYPADLLLRGQPKKVAHVRAMFDRTALDADAYLVASPEAQAIQGELSRLSDLLCAPQIEFPRAIATRLRQAYDEISRTDIAYDEWVILDAMARRIEARLVADEVIRPDDMPIARECAPAPRRAFSSREFST